MVSIDISHIHGGYVEIEKKKKKGKKNKKNKRKCEQIWRLIHGG